MARVKNGPYGPIVGKVGNTVSYIRLGQPVIRMIKHPTTKPPTLKQEAARARLALVSGFIRKIQPFINISFKPLSRKFIGKTAQNMAMSFNLHEAVTGEYPHYALDGTKLVLSRGSLGLPGHCAVEFDGEKLKFSWQGGEEQGHAYWTDQVMMFAYFPESKRSVYLAGGVRRNTGKDFLILYPEGSRAGATDTYVETYIAFVSNDRTDVSDSLYLGPVALD